LLNPIRRLAESAASESAGYREEAMTAAEFKAFDPSTLS
jgi:hypothetical protein